MIHFYSCYLLGEDHLLIQCAEKLLAHGYKILGIISPLEGAEEFAFLHNIDYFYSLKSGKKHLLSTHFDYLFSIVNSHILSSKILNKPHRLSINFHNAPLPHYAGVHGLSWAILNQEKSHGVTWHLMSDQIDGGDILEQIFFPIENNETALSLSIKCYEHALISFENLLTGLSAGKVHPIPQNLLQRHYYDFTKKPLGNGWISWEDSAENIERICRALELGHYHHNRFAVPKLKIGSAFYLIQKIQIVEQCSVFSPGTIVHISHNEWHIATQTKNLAIQQLCTEFGLNCSLEELEKQYHLIIGQKLLSPTQLELTQYQYFSEQISRAELFWVQQCLEFNGAYLPHLPLISKDTASFSYFPLQSIKFNQLEGKALIKALPPQVELCDVLLSIFLIYLYRMGNQNNLGVGLLFQATANLAASFDSLFFKILPFHIFLNNQLTFFETVEKIHQARCLFEKKGTCSNDIFYRYPELFESAHPEYFFCVIIDTKERIAQYLNSNLTQILVTISTDTAELTWWLPACEKRNVKLVSMILKCIESQKQLLEDTLKKIDAPIMQLNILSDDEKQILLKWGNHAGLKPIDATIVSCFEQQAYKTPEKIAVIYENKTLTYFELNKKANQLARLLIKKGVGKGSVCGICSSQELHLIIGVLAILKAGGAYLPLDLSYPTHHIQFLLENSHSFLLLTSKKYEGKIKDDCRNLNIPFFTLECMMDELCLEDETNLTLSLDSQDLAYVMYTSGTTGVPKGVMIPHQAVVRLVNNTNYIQFQSSDRIAQAASISFDAATFEIWGALLNGATLVTFAHSVTLDIEKFQKKLNDEKISILWLTSSLFDQYAAQKPSMFKCLKYLLVGGDVLNKERIFSVLNCKEGRPTYILNGYGPTENTTFTTTHLITSNDQSRSSIPIGTPISHTSVYLLDEALQMVPIGGIGEIYTGGAGLAKGYLDRSELTSEKFLFIQFNGYEERVYKTGDRARWLPNASIEYIGRVDNQVKIRGFRVELEEIQVHLLNHPSVVQCALKIIENNKHNKALVAYLVCNKLETDQTVREFLSARLPAYMMPSYFIFLKHLPLTMNGKIDYEKLPLPDSSVINRKRPYQPPISSIEKSLVNLWESILEISPIGINENFFELGGHSLLITQLLLKLKDISKIEIPVHEFLEQPTIQRMIYLMENKSTLRKVRLHKRNWDSEKKLLSGHHFPNFKSNHSADPQHILLTGGTGFLGAHLLNELYHKTQAVIYCLVREQDNNTAIARLNQVFSHYGFTLDCDNRIIPLLGELSLPKLGLTEQAFSNLAAKIDTIYHNGALVNHLYNYELLRPANVLSTLDIIRLASLTRPKTIHYISTLSAAANHLDQAGKILESFLNPTTDIEFPLDGYSQSKWISELLLAQAHAQDMPINIYRPGWILGQTCTGIMKFESNHLLRLIKGCIQFQAAPSWDLMLDIMPVDILSQLIVNSSLEKDCGKVFNLVNPNKISWKKLIQYLINRGFKISLVSPTQWVNDYLNRIDQTNAIFSLLPLYTNADEKDWMEGLSVLAKAHSCHTDSAFAQSNIIPPVVDEKLLDIYFLYLEKNGFLDTSYLV